MYTFKSWLLDLLFPRLCLGCEILLSDNNESYVCPACLAGIKMKNDFACAFCNSPVVEGKTCPFCRADHFLDRLFIATSYENLLVEKIIKTMKYRFIRSLANDMAEFMAKYLERRFSLGFNIDRDSTVVVPVPLHRRRLNWRGFNQAEIIGNSIGSYFKLNFQNLLVRIRNVKLQVEMLNRQSRITNAKNIFEFHPLNYGSPTSIVEGKTVLLIDDVATTGSTLDDCARALKNAGAKEVIGFVFARGTPTWDRKLLQ